MTNILPVHQRLVLNMGQLDLDRVIFGVEKKQGMTAISDQKLFVRNDVVPQSTAQLHEQLAKFHDIYQKYQETTEKLDKVSKTNQQYLVTNAPLSGNHRNTIGSNAAEHTRK